MCGLFGFSTYREKVTHDLTKLTNALAKQSSIRGTDATGIAFCQGGHIQIHKEALSASKLTFSHPPVIRSLIGHTRHSTQGSEKNNYNNHPFSGKAGGVRFALAHNGVLTNDDSLKALYQLPKTRIETDSYVAVQMIEKQREFSFASLRAMAEAVDGSFTFSLLDDRDNIYLVKGNSPLSILHFPTEKIYVFASTEEILYRGLIDSPLFDALREKKYEEIPIHSGTIMKISPDGDVETDSFTYKAYYGKSWYDYGYRPYHMTLSDDKNAARQTYIDELKYMAMFQGYEPSYVDELLAADVTLEEIEEWLYSEGELYERYY